MEKLSYAPSIFVVNLKEQADKATSRAKDLGLNVSRSQVMELLAAAYGAHNYHEVSRAAKHVCLLEVDGAQVDVLDLVDRTFDVVAAKEISFVVGASEPYGEVNSAIFGFSRESMKAFFLYLFHNGPQPYIPFGFDQRGWVNNCEMYNSTFGGMFECGFWFEANHKHSEGNEKASSEEINLKSFVRFLLSLASGKEKSVASIVDCGDRSVSLANDALGLIGFASHEINSAATFLFFSRDHMRKDFIGLFNDMVKRLI